MHSVCDDSLDTVPRPDDVSDTCGHHCPHFTAGKTEAWGQVMAFPSPARQGSDKAKLEARAPEPTFPAFVPPASSSVTGIGDGDMRGPQMLLLMITASGLLHLAVHKLVWPFRTDRKSLSPANEGTALY